MSLQKVISNYAPVPVSDFHNLITHLLNFHSNQNMHLRDIRVKNKKRTLRFLHMTRASAGSKIEGHISGPNNLCLQYELSLSGNQIAIFIKHHSGDYKELYRIAKNLSKWLIRRMNSEKIVRKIIRVKYTKGEFYLRRATPGMAVAHNNIQKGLQSLAFDQVFAKNVGSWGFEILNP